MVHSVLTQYNDSIEDMQSVYDTIKDMKHLVDWHVVKGDPTLYPKTDYSNIEINQSKMNSIIDFLAELNGQNDIIIRYPSKAYIPTADTQLPSEEDKEARIKSFFSRSMCSGLFSSLYILPDGQVTMCEQLYWNKRFIIGNVKTQSIAEIWNSGESQQKQYHPGGYSRRLSMPYMRQIRNLSLCATGLLQGYNPEWHRQMVLS